MKSELSYSRKNLLFKYNTKFFKEDQIESKESNLININQIKNFVPIIKPKKAHIRPTPFQLNPEEPLKKITLLCNKKFKESFNNSCKYLDEDDLASSNSDLSSTEKESKNETENLQKDFSSNEKSPIFKFKKESQEISF